MLAALLTTALSVVWCGGTRIGRGDAAHAQQASGPTDDAPLKLTAAQLDDLVARIALYPDPLLAQALAASSFPDQIPEAYKWAMDHKNLKGDSLAAEMQKAELPFDPSLQALIPFPTVLEMMNKDLDWTAKLGTSVLAQRGDVMDAVQRMRGKAQQAGNLKSTDQMKVVQSSPQTIELQPTNPQVIYVPVYNPAVVYVPAPPNPPPPPRPSTGDVIAAGIFGFLTGVLISNAFNDSCWGYHCGFNWVSHTVIVHNGIWGRTWVNRTTYVHTWGGWNGAYYTRPRSYYNRPVNININNVNINRYRANNTVINNGRRVYNPGRPANGGGGGGVARPIGTTSRIGRATPAARPINTGHQAPMTRPSAFSGVGTTHRSTQTKAASRGKATRTKRR